MKERLAEKRIATWPIWDRRDTVIACAWVALFLGITIAGWFSWPRFGTDPQIKDAHLLMDELAVQIHRYAAREGDWPESLDSLADVAQVQAILRFGNPREGFSGFAYSKPTHRYDLSDASLNEVPILYEVDDEGVTQIESGLVVYADGTIRYLRTMSESD